MSLYSPRSEFRIFQAIYDLDQAIGAASKLLSLSGIGLPKEFLEIENVLQFSGEPESPGRSSREICESIMLYSVSPDENNDLFYMATAFLLRHSLVHQGEAMDLDWHWDAYVEIYRSAPNRIRAAIVNGFVMLKHLDLVSNNVLPSIADRASHEKFKVIEALFPIAKSMTQEEMVHVSQADYGCSQEKHLKAIRDVLQSNDYLFPAGEVWYPAEVVELVAHVGGQIGFLPCTALLLINRVNDADGCEDISFRWKNLHDHYKSFPTDVALPIFNAVRYLYETDDEWDPFEGRKVHKFKGNWGMIPWTEYSSAVPSVITL